MTRRRKMLRHPSSLSSPPPPPSLSLSLLVNVPDNAPTSYIRFYTPFLFLPYFSQSPDRSYSFRIQLTGHLFLRNSLVRCIVDTRVYRRAIFELSSSSLEPILFLRHARSIAKSDVRA